MTLSQTSHMPLFGYPASRVISYLFPDERHHTDTSEHVLPGQALARDAICKRLGAISPGLTEVTHEQRHVGPGNTEAGREVANVICTCFAFLQKNTLQKVQQHLFLSDRAKKFQDSLELFLSLPSQVPDQPLVGESILRGHPIAHHCIQEGLPLPRVEAQNLISDDDSTLFRTGRIRFVFSKKSFCLIFRVSPQCYRPLWPAVEGVACHGRSGVLFGSACGHLLEKKENVKL